MKDSDMAFYQAWAKVLDWLREYAEDRDGVQFVKMADFTGYIYRMERAYDLPTTIMSASLSDASGKPVLMLTASPRQVLIKDIVVHPFDSHVYRRLKLSEDGAALVEGKRVFDRERLTALADDLFRHAVAH